MKEGIYTIKTTYDDAAYRTLAEGSWQLFMMPRLRSRVYPMLLALTVILAFSLIFRRDAYEGRVFYLYLGCAIFFLLAMPLIALRTKHVLFKKSVKDAKANKAYNEEVTFSFLEDKLRSVLRGVISDVSYLEIVKFAKLEDCFLFFFGQGAYMFPVEAVRGAYDEAAFVAFVEKKCGLPLTQMKKLYL